MRRGQWAIISTFQTYPFSIQGFQVSIIAGCTITISGGGGEYDQVMVVVMAGVSNPLNTL